MQATRQPDKPQMGNVKKDNFKTGAARRIPDFGKLGGWNSTLSLDDDSDLVTWMKREQNGENRRKVNGAFAEEQYRHGHGYCSAIENRLLFDRQSLHDRHRKHCQFLAKDRPHTAAAAVDGNGGDTSASPSSAGLSFTQKERSCGVSHSRETGSGIPLVDFDLDGFGGSKHDVSQERDGDDVREEDEEDDVEQKDPRDEERSSRTIHYNASRGGQGRGPARGPVFPVSTLSYSGMGQSHLASSAGVVADGMTSSYPPEILYYEAAVEAENGAAGDEGYGSKVSMSDQEGAGLRDPGEEDAAVMDDVPRVPAEEATVDQRRRQEFVRQGTLARLTYSGREQTAYTPLSADLQQRLRSGRYSDQEQPYLAGVGLNKFGPGLLPRPRHLSDLTGQPAGLYQTGPDYSGVVRYPSGGSAKSEASLNGLQPRTMVLRRITIQDAGRGLHSQNVQQDVQASRAYLRTLCNEIKYGPRKKTTPKTIQKHQLSQRQIQFTLNSPVVIHQEEAASEGSRLTDMTSSLTSFSTFSTDSLETQSVPATGAQDSTSPSNGEVESCNKSSMPVSGLNVASDVHSSGTPPDRQRHPGPLRSARAQRQGQPLSSYSLPAALDRLPVNAFPMTDLLPAVERRIRNQQCSQRGRAVVAQDSNPVPAQNLAYHQPRGGKSERPGSKERGYYNASAAICGGEAGPLYRSLTVRTAVENMRSFPAFRPHRNISQLQRVKEISNRRIHGLITQQPDGSETVNVPSPRYASRADVKLSNTRAKSASRSCVYWIIPE